MERGKTNGGERSLMSVRKEERISKSVIEKETVKKRENDKFVSEI